MTRVRRATVVLAVALVAAALAVAALAGCGSPAASGKDPLAGYWVGGGQQGLMTLVQIQKNGDTYTVLANPDAPAGDAVKEGESLVVDSTR